MIILLPFMAVQMLQTILGVLFVTAGKPNLGLGLTILSGLANMILDYIFIAVLDWGIGGAALATAVGYSIMPVYAFFYFFCLHILFFSLFISCIAGEQQKQLQHI